MPKQQQFEIIIFYRPVPLKNNHLVDLSNLRGDDICVAEGSYSDILSLYAHLSTHGWHEATRLKLTPPEETDEEKEPSA